MKHSIIYLDYASSTPPAECVVNEIVKGLSGDYVGNPSSSHAIGLSARECVEAARRKLCQYYGLEEYVCIFTSGATESNNIAIRGRPDPYVSQVLVGATDHPSSVSSMKSVSDQGGVGRSIPVDTEGRISLRSLKGMATEDRSLISVSHVNSETGVIQDVQAIQAIAQQSGALFHLDCAQSFGKMPESMFQGQPDLLSVSGHKMYGPKGVGALLLKKELLPVYSPLIVGGGQEFGLRSGTVATQQIMGLAEAFQFAIEGSQEVWGRTGAYKEKVIECVKGLGASTVNGAVGESVPYILNVSFRDIDSEMLLHRMPEFCLSRTSACKSGSLEPSHVLRAMKLEDDVIYGGFRVSFGVQTTSGEIDVFCRRLKDAVHEIRREM